VLAYGIASQARTHSNIDDKLCLSAHDNMLTITNKKASS